VPSATARTGNLAEGKITVSPAIVPYLALWPLPNGPLLGTGNTGQYLFTAGSPATEDTGLARLDHYFSQNDSLAVSWSTDKGETATPDALNSIFALNNLRRNTFALNSIHIFNPQLVNAFRFGVNRVTGGWTSPKLSSFVYSNVQDSLRPPAAQPERTIIMKKIAPRPGAQTWQDIA